MAQGIHDPFLEPKVIGPSVTGPVDAALLVEALVFTLGNIISAPFLSTAQNQPEHAANHGQPAADD